MKSGVSNWRPKGQIWLFRRYPRSKLGMVKMANVEIEFGGWGLGWLETVKVLANNPSLISQNDSGKPSR